MTHGALLLLLAQDTRPEGFEYAASVLCHNRYQCTLDLRPPLPVTVEMTERSGRVVTIVDHQGTLQDDGSLMGGQVRYYLRPEDFERHIAPLRAEQTALNEQLEQIRWEQEHTRNLLSSPDVVARRHEARIDALLEALEQPLTTREGDTLVHTEAWELLALTDHIDAQGAPLACGEPPEDADTRRVDEQECWALPLDPDSATIQALLTALEAPEAERPRWAFNDAPERWAQELADTHVEASELVKDHELRTRKHAQRLAHCERWWAQVQGRVFEIEVRRGPNTELGFTPRAMGSVAFTPVDSSHSQELGGMGIGTPWGRQAEVRVALTPEWILRYEGEDPDDWTFRRVHLQLARDVSVLPTDGKLDYRSLVYREWRFGLSTRWQVREDRAWDLSAGFRALESSTVYDSPSPLWRGAPQAQEVYQVAPKGPFGSFGVHGYYLELRRGYPLGHDGLVDSTPERWHREVYWALRLSDEPARETNDSYDLRVGDATEDAALPTARLPRLTLSVGFNFGAS